MYLMSVTILYRLLLKLDQLMFDMIQYKFYIASIISQNMLYLLGIIHFIPGTSSIHKIKVHVKWMTYQIKRSNIVGEDLITQF